MWPLEVPAFVARETFTTCRSRLRNIDSLHARLDQIEARFISEAASYDALAVDRRLHECEEHDQVEGAVTRAELIRLYESGMLSSKAGRHIYDAILAMAPNRTCPFCGHRRVRQLDHFLPKSKYPIFSIATSNLVPICMECNFDKLDASCIDASDTYFHPYFDRIDQFDWLSAEIVDEGSAVTLFDISVPPELDEIDSDRLNRQFYDLRLDELYSVEANDLLNNIRFRLRNLLSDDGIDGVRAHLQEEYNSAGSFRRNSWPTAFYQAAVNSDWFCGGGFDAGIADV